MKPCTPAAIMAPPGDSPLVADPVENPITSMQQGKRIFLGWRNSSRAACRSEGCIERFS
jgi:hypothetical protein